MAIQDSEFPKVHIKCKRGSSRETAGQSCDSMTVYKLSKDGEHVARFKCSVCGYQWHLALGGTINIG